MISHWKFLRISLSYLFFWDVCSDHHVEDTEQLIPVYYPISIQIIHPECDYNIPTKRSAERSQRRRASGDRPAERGQRRGARRERPAERGQRRGHQGKASGERPAEREASEERGQRREASGEGGQRREASGGFSRERGSAMKRVSGEGVSEREWAQYR